MLSIINFTHSLDPKTGGVLECVQNLQRELTDKGFHTEISANTNYNFRSDSFHIAHGLWQWPGVVAYNNCKRKSIPYLVYPHGMLDPWFKKAYPIKHLKKQLYWWWRQRKILENAHAVCFTTEEERRLAQKTFGRINAGKLLLDSELESLQEMKNQVSHFQKKFTQTRGKDFLLYMGRIHPKKGLDLLLKAFAQQKKSNDLLVIAAPISEDDIYHKTLRRDFKDIEGQILWTDMLEGDLKWGALRAAR